MMEEVQEEAIGITIGGQNCTNLRYADDAVFLDDNESELQYWVYYLQS